MLELLKNIPSNVIGLILMIVIGVIGFRLLKSIIKTILLIILFVIVFMLLKGV